MTARLPRSRRLAVLAAVVVPALAGPSVGLAPGGQEAAQAVAPAYSDAPPSTVAAAPSVTSKSQPLATFASLNACSVVPGQARAWSVGYYAHGSAQLAYALHTTKRGRWVSVAVQQASAVYLQGVAAGSATSIWAVGDHLGKSGEEPLIERSTGAGFAPVKAKLGMGSLQAVSASSATNAWAVGTHPSGAPLVTRWDGRSWRQVNLGKLPAGAGTSIQLVGVAVSGAGNVWLVGETTGGPLVARWNGHSFDLTLLTAPAVVAGMVPTAISTTSPGNVWLAGYVPGSASSGGSTIVTSHHDGSGWAPVSVPSTAVRNVPSSIAAVGGNVYLAGYAGPKSLARSKPFVLELSGGHWRGDTVAKPGRNGVLLAVCASAKGAAGVGAWYSGDVAGAHRTPPRPLLLARHGPAWRRSPT